MAGNTIEVQPSSMTTVSSPKRKKVCCTIVIVIFGIIVGGALTMLALRYRWGVQANRKTTTVRKGIVVLESGCGTGPR
ncbi:unnamed protein product, partial [Adineta steineri]